MNSRRIVAVLALALLLSASTEAVAKQWRLTTEAENKLVFTGHQLDAYEALHYYRPITDESDYPHEHYRTRWTLGSHSRTVFQMDLQILRHGLHYDSGASFDLEGRARRVFKKFKGMTFSTVDSGTVGTALGPAEFLIFTAGKYRCARFRLHFHDGGISELDAFRNSLLEGFYCPDPGHPGQVDAEVLESILSRVGVRGVAVPPGGEPRTARQTSQESETRVLATLVTTGDIRKLRRMAARDFDPDTIIPFRHPRFARGRVIRRPILVAAALFGQTEMVVFLLNRGASTRGRSAGAICAAIARRHRQIVDVLLKKDSELKRHDRCGATRSTSAIALARRLKLHDVVDKLLETNP